MSIFDRISSFMLKSDVIESEEDIHTIKSSDFKTIDCVINRFKINVELLEMKLTEYEHEIIRLENRIKFLENKD